VLFDGVFKRSEGQLQSLRHQLSRAEQRRRDAEVARDNARVVLDQMRLSEDLEKDSFDSSVSNVRQVRVAVVVLSHTSSLCVSGVLRVDGRTCVYCATYVSAVLVFVVDLRHESPF
jgi:hypothetical protein